MAYFRVGTESIDLVEARKTTENTIRPASGLSQIQNGSIVVEWLALLLCIRDVPGSNLGPETGYPEVFVVFLSPSRQMPG
jgi:hypothetical protein